MLVLAGAADRVLPLSESEWLADAIPGALLEVFGGAGHMLPVERAEQVAATMLRFLDDVDRATGARSPAVAAPQA